jgi:hypothetical protein
MILALHFHLILYIAFWGLNHAFRLAGFSVFQKGNKQESLKFIKRRTPQSSSNVRLFPLFSIKSSATYVEVLQEHPIMSFGDRLNLLTAKLYPDEHKIVSSPQLFQIMKDLSQLMEKYRFHSIPKSLNQQFTSIITSRIESFNEEELILLLDLLNNLGFSAYFEDDQRFLNQLVRSFLSLVAKPNEKSAETAVSVPQIGLFFQCLGKLNYKWSNINDPQILEVLLAYLTEVTSEMLSSLSDTAKSSVFQKISSSDFQLLLFHLSSLEIPWKETFSEDTRLNLLMKLDAFKDEITSFSDWIQIISSLGKFSGLNLKENYIFLFQNMKLKLANDLIPNQVLPQFKENPNLLSGKEVSFFLFFFYFLF